MDVIKVARELQAIAQSGLHFSEDVYDRERYERVRELAAEMLAAESTVPREKILSWYEHEFGYATPKVDVRAFIDQDQTVFLIREDADGGRWTLPGGWADVNETPAQAIVREVHEECGYLVTPVRLLAVLDREHQGHTPPFPYHVYKLFFHCRIVGGRAQQTAESSASAFFARQRLPDLSVSRVLPQQIESFFAAIAASDDSTRFD